MFVLLAFASLFVFTKETSPPPYGHLLPIGSHRLSDGHIEILTKVPHPIEFWKKYVSKGEPVLLRGAAHHSPGSKLWTDEYLLENYGKFKVKIESKFEKHSSPVGVFGIGQERLSNFIGRYKEDDIYVVSQLPDPMGVDVAVPPCLLCGTFKQQISEANIWFSSGGTKSLLHRDADDAINCLYNGTKHWIMIHPRDEKNIPIAKEVFDAYGGFSILDPDKVDLLKHPQFVNVPWKYVDVEAGDCLFLPRGYWHRVTSEGDKNVAVSLLFGRINKFEPINCDNADSIYKPLSEVGTVWAYDGFGIQSMGNDNPFQLNETLQELCLQSLEHKISLEDMIDYLMQGIDTEEIRNLLFKDKANTYEDYVTDIGKKLLNTLGDTTQRGYVTCEEVKHITLTQLKEFSLLTSMDPGNTEEMEYYEISKKDIQKLMKTFADDMKNMDSAPLSFEKLSEKYQKIGGTNQVAQVIFSMLDVNMDNYVTAEEINENTEQVASLYDRISVFGSGIVMDDVKFDFESGGNVNEIPDLDEHQRDEL